jgi:hypothetical protein
MGLSVRIMTATVAAGLCVEGASAGRPGPPPEWSSRLSQPPLRPGALVTYRYDATSDDPLRLRVAVSAVSRQLRLAGKTAWLLEFPGDYAVTRRAGIRIRVRSTAVAGSRLCLTLQQHALNHGADDFVAKRVCGRVRK